MTGTGMSYTSSEWPINVDTMTPRTLKDDWISSKIDGCAAASGDERVFSARRLGFLFLLHFVGNLPHPHLRITVSPSPP